MPADASLTPIARPREKLSPTALYTAGVWLWAGLPGAELFDHRAARRIFRAVNGALAVAGLFFRRPPSLRHSLVQRHVMIDRLVAESGEKTLVELAAGLSARGVRLSADPALTVVELDRPEMMARKRALLAGSVAGRAALARPNLRLVDGDVAETPLEELVADGPALVVTEGLLMYLDAAAQRRFFERVRAFLSARGGGALIFDLVPAVEQPRPGVVGRTLGKIWRRATRGGAFARDARTRDDVVALLREVGFAEVTLHEPATAPAAWRVPHLDRRTQQLVFVAR